MQIIKLNEQYLSFENPGNKILAIKSAKGTGKTKWLENNVPGAALFLTHRVALGREIATRNGAAFYQDAGALKAKRLVITADSLKNLAGSDVHDGATIVIDEATQFLRHLKGDTCRKYRKDIYETLAVKIYHAKEIILLDADLADWTIDFFQAIAEVEVNDVAKIENDWVKSGRKFVEYKGRNDLVHALLKDALSGKNVYIACDTRASVEKFEALLREALLKANRDPKVLSVHGGNSAFLAQSNLIDAVNEEQKKYQVVIASPTLGTGVDISEPWFEKVYLIGDGYASTAEDLLQAAARVRNVDEVNFWMSPKKFSKIEEVEGLINEWKKLVFAEMSPEEQEKLLNLYPERWAVCLDKKTRQPALEPAHEAYLRMVCTCTAAENKSLNNLRESFVGAASKEGIITQAETPNGELTRLIGEILKAIGNGKQLTGEKILKALKLSTEEYNYLMEEKSKSPLLEGDELAILRYQLLEKVGGEEKYLAVIAGDMQRWHKALWLQNLLRRDVLELTEKDRIDEYEKLPTDRSFRVKTQKLMMEFNELIGMEGALQGQAIRADGVAEWARKNKFGIEQFLGVKVPKDIEKAPMRFVNFYLQRIGFETEEEKQISVGGGKRVRPRIVTPGSVETVGGILRAQGEARENARRARDEEESPL